MRFATFAAAAFCLATASHASAQAKPNIIIILTDDLGPGDLGCYGGKIANTPNIDGMAKAGIRFTQFYVASPICSPSRCGLLTGGFPARHKITSYMQTRAGNRGCEQVDFLDPQVPTLPRLLKGVGYRTAHFGKWHLGGGRDVVDAPKFAAYGYDVHAGTWESPEPHPDITAINWIWSDKDKVKRWDRTAFFVERTLDFLKQSKGSPCFVNLWLDDPHTPWVPAMGAKKGNARENLKGVMEETDRQIGRLMAGLKALGIDDNTLVIFLSDNGPLPTFNQARTMGLRGSKLSLYEGGVRLPCIVHWPGKTPVDRVDDVTVLSAVDFLPTLYAIAGAALPEGAAIDGEDRGKAFLGAPLKDRRRPLFWEYGRNEKFFSYPDNANRSPNLAIRDGNWKLLMNADGTGVELYDLLGDAREADNLAEKQPETAARLKKSLLDWRKSVP